MFAFLKNNMNFIFNLAKQAKIVKKTAKRVKNLFK